MCDLDLILVARLAVGYPADPEMIASHRSSLRKKESGMETRIRGQTTLTTLHSKQVDIRTLECMRPSAGVMPVVVVSNAWLMA